MRILVSGGHLTPALAFIDYVQQDHQDDEVVFVGREFSRESDKQVSRERVEVEARNVQFIAFSAQKSAQSLATTLLKMPRLAGSVLKAIAIVSKQKPDVFLSFGGYVAVPLAVACWLQQIPVVTHEQTRAVGVSNQFIGRIAKKIAISFPDSKQFFPSHKTVVTGNLLRKQLTKRLLQKPDWLESSSDLPMLYITGGSQGSEVINTTISQMLPRLLKEWQVIHQCGADSNQRSYQTELKRRKQQLTKPQQARYWIREWLTEPELAWIYKHATAVVSRSGANTTQELAFHCVPSVLIPLPFSHFQEQQLNAEALAKTGGAIIIQQKQLTVDTLLEALDQLKSKNNACRRKLKD
jgi:UDP-N-acetylglucosamine--N-acetylmuramyl-(pentapeptide) pyrophosphoryl-undecaprenol N-acetylglucosamine transferase